MKKSKLIQDNINLEKQNSFLKIDDKTINELWKNYELRRIQIISSLEDYIIRCVEKFKFLVILAIEPSLITY